MLTSVSEQTQKLQLLITKPTNYMEMKARGLRTALFSNEHTAENEAGE